MSDGVLIRENFMDLIYFLRHHKAPQDAPELHDWSCECNGRLDKIVAHDAALREKLGRCRELLEEAHELLAEEADALTADYVALRQRIREMLTELEADDG